MPRFDYLKDPAAITRRSFELVRQETDLSRVPAELEPLALRLVHATGMPEIVPDLVAHGDVMEAGTRALMAGSPVIVDCRMVQHGIMRRHLPASNAIICTLDDSAVPRLAAAAGTTRSAAAVDLWTSTMEGAVIAIGNAPTALFRLLELLEEGAPRPAAVLAFPVGFVGAAESKEALISNGGGRAGNLPFVTLRGRRGGSALAAAAVNALALAAGGSAA